MKDLERLLNDSLKSVGDAYGPADPIAARQRFLKRRRRRLFRVSFGGAVAAATAVAVILYVATAPGPAVRRPALDVTSRFLAVTKSIPVGGAPSGIDIGGAGVWVANSGDSTVMRINQATNEVAQTVDVGGHPDDVAVGEDAVWVSDPDRGIVTKIELPDGSAGAPIKVAEPGQHLDIAYGEGAVWVVAAGEGVLKRIDPETDQVDQSTGARLASDVSVENDGTPWTLGRRLGRREIYRSDPARVDFSSGITEASGDLGTARTNVDLAVGDEHLWISSNTGLVLMVDPRGSVIEEHEVGGSYTGIAIYRGLAWAVTGGLDDEVPGSGLLTRFDDDTGERVGEPLALTGRPFDVAVGRTGIWLTHNSTNTVSHISDTESPAPAPTPEPEETEAAFIDPNDVNYVFAADGDLWADMVDGDLVPITDTREEETHPSIGPEGTSLAFERGGGRSEIVELDLVTGEETVVARGEWPAYGPDGRLAWVEDQATEVARIVVRGVDGAIEHDVVAEPGETDPGSPEFRGPSMVRHGSWDPDGDRIYYQAGWESFDNIYRLDTGGTSPEPEVVSEEANAAKEGALTVAPSAGTEAEVVALWLCCSAGADDRHEQISLARIDGTAFEVVTELDPELIDPFGDPYLVDAGNGRALGPGWFVGSNDGLWHVSENGESTNVWERLQDQQNFRVFGGITVMPEGQTD